MHRKRFLGMTKNYPARLDTRARACSAAEYTVREHTGIVQLSVCSKSFLQHMHGSPTQKVLLSFVACEAHVQSCGRGLCSTLTNSKSGVRSEISHTEKHFSERGILAKAHDENQQA